MDKYTKIAGANAAVNLADQIDKLNYLEQNIQDKEIVQKVKKSYHNTFLITLLLVLILFIITTVIFSINMVTIDKYNSENTREGHVNGETLWYIQNNKHEIVLSNYGINYKDYNDGDKFIVVLDKSYQVIELIPKKEFESNRNKKISKMIVMIPIDIIILILSIPISRKTYGKAWFQYNSYLKSLSTGNKIEDFKLE